MPAGGDRPIIMVEFKVDGGRYRGNGDGTGDCDTCDAKSVPLISIHAAEDQSETGVCEACVRRMLVAFVK